jgi:tetratricopeptide (TPR) repeat protein
MNPRVLRRFVIYMAILTVVAFLGWELVGGYVRQEPGDYHTKRGDQFLTSKDYDAALEQFDLALDEMENHRGALAGRALVFIQTERYDEALAELDYLIDYLTKNTDPDDPTGIGALAAAYANRGIVYDRLERYELALENYIEALKIDSGAVEGPGVIHQILYGSERVSSVLERARYLHEQLQLPEDERVLKIDELDARQRMHKP